MKQVACSSCGQTFGLQKNVIDKYSTDGLCGKCRSHQKYLSNIDKYRKTKQCPTCGKEILENSAYCNRCSQLGSKNHSYKHGNAMESRTCSICGNSITTGSKTGICQNCYLSNISGEANPNYRHGLYANGVMNTKDYLNWRLAVYERDSRICQVCGLSVKHTGHAHHIFPKRDYPELIFDINNGITLCPRCHENTYKHEYEFVEQFLELINNQAEVKSRN